jgi:hypothetical protein
MVLTDTIDRFEGGVNTAAPADLLPSNTSPRALNSVLASVSRDVSIVAKRAGATTVNATPITGTPAVIGQFQFRQRSGAITTNLFHLLVSSNGRLDKKLSDNTVTAADSGTPAPFTSGTYIPSGAVMGNRIHIANGNETVVFNGTDVFDSGLEAPAAPTASVGAAGVMTGDYLVAVTYYDSATGLESSLSPYDEVTLTSDQLDVSWTAYAGQHPYTHTRVHIQKVGLTNAFFQVAEVATPATSTSLNLSDDDINALIILSPDEDQNDPIPATVTCLAGHVSRLFASDAQQVYFSQLNQPEAFDPDHKFTVNTDDGKPITAIHSAHEVLIVWKRDSMWALYGEEPADFRVRLVSPDVGCLSHRSVFTIEGITYWWSEQGPMAWNGAGAPVPIGLGVIDPTISPTALSYLGLDPTPAESIPGVCGCPDIINQRVLWAVPTINSTRNDLILPFNYRLGVWESSAWTLMDAASLAAIEDFSSQPQVFLGGYKGQIFQLGGSALNDGVPSGTSSGTITSISSTVLTDSTAAFVTTGAGLRERYVYHFDSLGGFVQRRRIGSNTATALTLDTGQTFDPVPSVGNTYAVGGPNFQYDTGWRTFDLPFIKKRLEFGHFLISSNSSSATVTIQLFTDYNEQSPTKSYTLATNGNGLIWDEGNWDEGLWGSAGTGRGRKRLAKVAFTYRYRIIQSSPEIGLALMKMGCRAETLTDKS